MRNCKNTNRQQRGTTRETRLKPQRNGLRGQHEHLASDLVADAIEALFNQAKLARSTNQSWPSRDGLNRMEGGRAA